MHVVICGGGVIGACTGYFLARRGIDVTVVERSEVASSASGKAGGFLALDWCAGSPLDALARRSFALHASLHEEVDGDWGYRRMTAYSGLVVPERDKRRHVTAELDLAFRRRDHRGATEHDRNDGDRSPAIVHSGHDARGAAARRADCITARSPASSAAGTRSWGSKSTARLFGRTLSSSRWGPGLCALREWLQLPAVFGLKSPSLVYDTGTEVPAEALFLEYQEDSGNAVAVEVFPRADGSTHVAAFADQDPLPLDPADVKPDPAAIDSLQAICERLSPAFRADRIIARQACFRPVTQDGLPLIGKVPGSEGAYIATGHSVWGILNAPATGEAMAELIADGSAKTTDLTPFDPARLRPLDPASIRIA